jgi:hypothetical protein
MREDLPWIEDWHDMDGNKQVLTFNQLQFGKKICHGCYTDIKPVFTCKKCRCNSCDACSLWARAKSRITAVSCPECKTRIGILI